MERIIDDYESRRRAEEIYSRRNGINIEKTKKKYFSIYKFLFQLLVLINLAICLIVYKNKNFVFNTEFLNTVNEFYNINVYEKIEDFFIEEETNNVQNKENVQTSENTLTTENLTNTDNSITNTQSEQTNKEVSLVDKIKNSYSFIKPLEGTITSFFGQRDSSNEDISGFHTGIDISAVQGTKIKSAISGNVIEVSSEGNYGNHVKIQKDDVITLYAHCKTILVKEGDTINQGQDIAEVGSTGKSTGPHLHFEIRYLNECINPSDFINF